MVMYLNSSTSNSSGLFGSDLEASLHHQPIDEHRSAPRSDDLVLQTPDSGILCHSPFELHTASPGEMPSLTESVKHGQPGSRDGDRTNIANTKLDGTILEITNSKDKGLGTHIV
jgi:hypothetical protein